MGGGGIGGGGLSLFSSSLSGVTKTPAIFSSSLIGMLTEIGGHGSDFGFDKAGFASSMFIKGGQGREGPCKEKEAGLNGFIGIGLGTMSRETCF